MSSPSTRSSARRRQRSTRLVTAVTLVASAAVFAVVSVVLSMPVLTAVAAVVGVLLGAAATKIVHTELVETRRAAAKDRADQARAYVEVTQQRTAENIEFAKTMERKIVEREQTIHELELELGQAQRQAAEAARNKFAEARRANVAEAEQKVLQRSLTSLESQSAEAVVRVAELEGELDTLRSELNSWRATANEQARKHA